MASRRRGDPLGENDSVPLMIEPASKLGQRFGPSGRDRKRGVDSTVRVSPRRPSSAVSATYAHGGGRLGLDLLQYLLDAVREAARCPIRDRQFVPDALMVATRGADVVRGRELPQTRGPARDCVGLSLLSVDSPCAGRGVTEAVRASPTAVLRPAGDLCARRRSPRPRCGRW